MGMVASDVAVGIDRGVDRVATVNLEDPKISLDQTPDLAGESPDGTFFYVAARGRRTRHSRQEFGISRELAGSD
jgi:hypothetical protein